MLESFILSLMLFSLFLCWGSFLNVVAYRLIHENISGRRSRCIHCHHLLAWYDLIPLISFMVLKGKCRYCCQPLSWLYPAIELITAVSLFAGYYSVDSEYYGAYFILISALIITIRTDFESLLISRWVTTALIPVGFLLSIMGYLPISPLNSLFGAAAGYIILSLIGSLFYFITKKEGIGLGDFDLLAMIGAFTGVIGVWATLLLGSIIGSVIGSLYLLYKGSLRRYAKLPFGPFLVIGALVYIFFHEQITELLLGG